ncbi:hypothetical protein NW754_007325 [Fusarium falciforme]|uniref:Uncharacterized protein n=1 Tax=Fusarium falciforme TaxID=195108 RepID=A0A9W8R8N3_9HYPO|nr:hypothetical protein NW754_007325 [Fusarium falciforme]KAJ4188528.1 hypothetical protein NW755_006690 [Fusarium falciforme]
MRPSIAASLAFGLLGADLAAGSVCMPRLSSSVTDASLTTSSETTYTSLSASSTATESLSTSTSISVESSETAQSTSETSSLATLSTSVTTSAESVSTGSSEVVSESATTLVIRTSTAESASTSSSEVASESSSTTAESTTASTTIESSTAQTTTSDSSTTESSTIVESSTTTDSSTALTTTTEPATTDSSTTESSAVSSTSSAPFVNPTFYFQVNGGNLDDELVKNAPDRFYYESRLQPIDTRFVATPAYVEEGTGRLRTLFNDYYLCIRGVYSRQAGALLPAEVQLCNTQAIAQADANRYQYLTCRLTGSNGISCSAQGVSCLTWSNERNDGFRCDVAPDASFTQFSIYPITGARGYVLYLGPEGTFSGYETVEFKRKVVEQS